MERVIVTRAMVGICHMQVCAVKDATDQEILEVCNTYNPSGTRAGWVKVIRSRAVKGGAPVQCNDHSNRVHVLVEC